MQTHTKTFGAFAMLAAMCACTLGSVSEPPKLAVVIADANPEVDRGLGADRGSTIESGSQDDLGPNVKPEPNVAPEPVGVLSPKVEPGPNIVPASKAEPVPKVEPGPNVIPAPKAEPVPKVEPGPNVVPAPKADLVPKVEPGPNVGPDPEVEPRSPLEEPHPYGATFQRLEAPLLKLLSALTKSLESNSDTKDLPTKILDFFAKLAVLVSTILGSYVTYLGLRKIPWFKKHQELIGILLVAVSLLVLFYLLSGLVTSVLFVLVAVLVLLVALVLAAAHLIKFIDEKFPDVRDDILAHFSRSTSHRDMAKLIKGNIQDMHHWLSNVCLVQKLSGDVKLNLDGSFVEGYDKSTFEIQPDESVDSHWENINDRMLIPIKASLVLTNSLTNVSSEVVNIQTGLVVIRSQGSIEFKGLSPDGFRRLGGLLIKWQVEQHKKLIEQQEQWAANIKVFNSQNLQ